MLRSRKYRKISKTLWYDYIKRYCNKYCSLLCKIFKKEKEIQFHGKSSNQLEAIKQSRIKHFDFSRRADFLYQKLADRSQLGWTRSDL